MKLGLMSNVSKLKSKIKVLYVHHGYGIGGAPISLINLIKYLDQDNYELKVLCLQNSNVVGLFRQSGIDVEIYPSNVNWFVHNKSGSYSLLHFYKYLQVYRSWKRVAYFEAKKYFEKSDKYDIIHLNSHVLTSWAYAAKKYGYKVVLHNREAIYNGIFGIRYGILRKLINENCDLIVNISQDNLNRLSLQEKSVVVYNAIELPPKSDLKVILDREDLKVLYLGGASRIKGFKEITAALTYLNPMVKIDFAGNYPSISKTRELSGLLKSILKKFIYFNRYKCIRKIENSTNARIIGFVNEPLEILPNYDLLVSPFVESHFARPIIEAFAVGRPVVASNVEGMDEIVTHGEDGLLYQFDRPEKLAQTLNCLVGNKEKLKKMGAQGRIKAEKFFGAEFNARKMESYYRKLVSEK